MRLVHLRSRARRMPVLAYWNGGWERKGKKMPHEIYIRLVVGLSVRTIQMIMNIDFENQTRH